MKIIKKVVALILVCVLTLTLCACHGKDEAALTIDGIDITTALYLSAFIDSETEAKQKVDEQLAASESETPASEETDYYSQKIDGVSFEDYIKTNAIKRCKEFVFYQKLINDKVISVTDEDLSEAEYYASQYWSSSGYQYLYEPNGVSYDTFKKTLIYSTYSNIYFNHIYGKGGEKEVPQKDIKDNMLDNYALAYVLSASYPDNATDSQKQELKDKLESYGKRLKKGEDYLKIYNELNGTSETAPEKQDNGPKDVYAQIIADKDSSLTNYASSDFDHVYEMNVGTTEIFENEEKTGLTLYLRLDINSDEYYLTSLTNAILLELKQDEFKKDVDKKLEKLEVTEHSWAINRIKAKDIDYSQIEAMYEAAQQQQQQQQVSY